jgi:hypothetical protein
MEAAGCSGQLGAFSATPKTGLCGAPLFAPATTLRAVAKPLQSLARLVLAVDPSAEFCNAKLRK